MITFRDAAIEDLPKLLDIYNWAVENTTASFDLTSQTLEQRKVWFSHYGGKHPLIVAEMDGVVVGYASLSEFRQKEGYATTAEVSVYVDPDYHRRGIGKALLAEIISLGRKKGYHCIMAGITGGNDVSVKMHQSFGFTYCGNFKEVARKFDKWQDCLFYQLIL
jgi:phosphinothricin acetyltransferase